MEKVAAGIWIFLFGAVIGSFLNVCIYRIPRGEEVVKTPSHCPRCGKTLKWYELIPIVSFFIQGGRCRNCKERISFQYPVVESANGLFYLWIFCRMGYQPLGILYCLCTSVLMVLAVIDWRTLEIPPGCNYFIGGLGVIRLLLEPSGWKGQAVGFLAVSGLFLLVYLITKGNGIGGGDIKLMAAAGFFIGWQKILLALAIGSIVGSVIHISLMKLKDKSRVLAFGPYLALGIFCAMLYGDELISWYLRFCGF
ncbi:MAG: prepilin peptidase [Lachnospiraceae bacterium]|nr:prepilin peptidase [Lachnospiraceae bacterium]